MPRSLSISSVLGIIGMIAYPVCVAGLAWTVGQQVSAVVGWLVALAGAVAVGAPKLSRDLDAKTAGKAQQAWQSTADPAGRVETRAMQPTTPALPGLPVAGPAVARPYDD